MNRCEWLAVFVHIVWAICKRAREAVTGIVALDEKVDRVQMFDIAYERERPIVIRFAFRDAMR